MSSVMIPTEDELRTVLVSLRGQNPSLGVPKLHGLLITAHPDWTVSEKRTRKILQSQGLTVTQSYSANPTHIYPSSRFVKGLDVRKWSKKVEVKDFGKEKGKGLVAIEHISEGEVVWKEDPFTIAPEWGIYDLQVSSRACAHCTTPLGDSSLVTECPASSSASHCPARFCNRLCLSRSSHTHPLLCPCRNPASVPLITFAREMQWLALHSLAHCTARVLLANQEGEDVFDADWQVVCGLAELGMEERFSSLTNKGVELDRATWKKAHKLFVHAFQDPPTDSMKKKLGRILKKPLREDVSKAIFEYNSFLRGLGRVSLNQEAHGGIYILHSHLNHSCVPNISIRHLDQRTALSRITVLARADIEPGHELLVSYVDPYMGVKARRQSLQQWGFGTCRCERCVEEEKALPKGEVGEDDMDGLVSELKAGLGVGNWG